MSKIAYLYPGQGSQYAGMCRQFYETESAVRKLFDEASELLSYDLAALMFASDGRLDETQYTQPAMVAMELALTPFVDEVLREKGLSVSFSAGLSLGEYAAIAEAGGIDALAAIKTAAERGKLMQNAVPKGEGAMAAVLGANAQLVQEVVNGISGVWVANYNCPGQIVITGKKDAVTEACTALSQKGAKRCVPLNVSGPFHSPLLKEAGDSLYAVLKEISWKTLSHPYAANVDAALVTEPSHIAESLRRQVSSSVLWEQSVKTMLAAGADTFIEIGPGKTLSGFMRKIAKAYAEETGTEASGMQVYHVETPEDLSALREKL